MAKILHKCPICNKTATLKSESKLFGSTSMRTYECGHSEMYTGVKEMEQDTLNITSLDGKRPFPFQLQTAEFAEKADIRFLCAHEMGLGKTVIAQILMVAHPEVMPAAVFCKAGLKIQWHKETVRWGDKVFQIIDDTKTDLIPGFDGYIISMDSAWRIGKRIIKGNKSLKIKQSYEDIPGKSLAEQLAKCKVKLAVIDECQLIKNGQSERTNGIRNACRDIKHVIALSGTPIKNNAAEYFPILNLLRPDKFPKENQFLYGWCDTYFDGYKTRTGGLKNPEKFQDYTKDFIIRFERKDVLPDLPLIFRQFNFCELGEMIEEAYEKVMREFNDFYDESGSMGGFERASNILAYLSKMRHLAGLAKVDPVCEYVEQFIMTMPRERKIMLFVHHKDVGETLKVKLEQMAKEYPAEWGYEIAQIVSEMDGYERERQVDIFKSDRCRIMIGSTLASGEGLNLQFCQDCIMVERQWNPANEEQAEARFPRPGSTADKINAIYFVATNSVDEFFSELVERKREIVQATMAGKAVAWDQSSLVQELGQIIRDRGGKKWGF